MNNYKKLEAGRSMIEMLGVLAIIGVLSVGGIAGYSKAMNKFKTNKVADNVSMIVTNIRTLYAQQSTYDGLTNKTAVQMGVVPNELYTTTPTDATTGLTNAFLGSVVIGSATVTGLDGEAAGGGADRGFFVTMNGLTREACVTLATNDWGSGYSAGFVGLKIATSAQTAAPEGFTVTCEDHTADKWCSSQNAMQVSVAAAGCNADGNTNSVTWVFY